MGLSTRLMALTIGFVLLAEVLIYVPSISFFRLQYLDSKIASAQLASLAVEASQDNILSPVLEAELLTNAGVMAVALRRDSVRYLMLAIALPDHVDGNYDLRETTPLSAVYDAFTALFSGKDRIIRVLNMPPHAGGDIIDIVVREAPLRQAMIDYSWNVLGISMVISLITAGLIYISLHLMLVGPMRHITASMAVFRQHPEDVSLAIIPSARADEVGIAERELAEMQSVIRASLRQKAHLAELGAAVSKINHDLRNILASAQLVSDRLSALDDPAVRRLTPGLIQSLRRAIDLCTSTLGHGRAGERPPRRLCFELAPLIDEIGAAVCLPPHAGVLWVNAVPDGFDIDADPDHIFRIVQNLGRNAVQALGAAGLVRIEAHRAGKTVNIDVIDNGPGVSLAARGGMFEPFACSTSDGGAGLGLSISRELSRAHGGDLRLLRTGNGGTVFRIEIPDQGASANDNLSFGISS